MKAMRSIHRGLMLAGLLLALLGPGPASVYAQACDEAALDAVLAGGTLDMPAGCVIHITGEKVVTGDVTINGNGGTIQGNNTFRIFRVIASGHLTLNNVVVTGGNAQGDAGGGIYNGGGTLTINNSSISGNFTEALDSTDDSRGGGIANEGGTVTISGSTISGNTVDVISGEVFGGVGGGVYNLEGTVTVTDSTISGNTAYFVGGGIYNDYGTVTVTGSTISDNHTDNGGGISSYHGTLTVTDSTISDNSAAAGGGINGQGGTVTITGGTLSANTAGLVGGGIYNTGSTMTITNSTISDNYAGYSGGGIENVDGTVTVDECSLIQGNSAPIGNGIINQYFFLPLQPQVVVRNSSIYDEMRHAASTGSMSAEDNWWGTPDGPGALAVGFTVTSWLTEPPACAGGVAGVGERCTTGFTFTSADPAPVGGEVRFYTEFGYDLPLRPEGRFEAALPVAAGQPASGRVTVGCDRHVRAWLFEEGKYAVGLVPSQYENGDGAFVPGAEDFGVGGKGHANPDYFGRFGDPFPPGAGYDAAQPDVSDDVLVTTEQDNGHVEWGLWYEGGGYVVLGWTWTGEDGATGYAVPEGGPLSLEEFQQVVQAHGG